MTFNQIVETIVGFIDKLITILVGVAFLALVYSLFKYIWGGKQSSKENSQLKSRLWAGIIGMFVIASLWGLVRFIGGFLNLF